MNGETSLTRAASVTAATMRFLADDVACLLFPRAGDLPSEELQASVRLSLKLLVSGVEGSLGVPQEDELPQSWELLCRSGLLREPQLIDYCLARIAESRIRARLARSGLRLVEQLPARLLHDEDVLLAATARNVLVAENQSSNFDGASLTGQLPPELLHGLAWRIVAVLKTEGFEKGRSLESACQAMLANRSDSRLLQTSAAKLVYFLPAELCGDLSDPSKSGLPVFIAATSARTGVAADLIYRFADDDGIEPILIVFRACGFDAGDAFALAHLLRGTRVEDHNLPALLEQYEKLSIEDAARHCLAWAEASSDGLGALS